MVFVNTKQVKELTGLTDDRLDYLIEKVDALKREKTQGKAREYSFRDLVLLKLASLMRSDGIRLDEINEVISQVNENWKNPDNIQEAGVITILPKARKKSSRDAEEFLNSAYSIIKESNQEQGNPPLPESRPTLYLWSSRKWLIPDDDPEFSKYSDYLPGAIYNVTAIARELSKGDQLELDIMSDEMAVA